MENNIHSSAIIEGSVDIHPSAKILANCIIFGPVKIGADTVIGPNVVIGTPAQHRDFLQERDKGLIEIGERCNIREFVSIHKPCKIEATRIGNDVLIMAASTINHDCVIEDNVVITSNVTLAGNVHVMQRANLGQGSSFHQNLVIGSGAMIAMNAAVSKNIPPFATFIPGRPLKANSVGLERSEFSEDKELLEAALKGDLIDADKKLGTEYKKYREHAAKTDRAMLWS